MPTFHKALALDSSNTKNIKLGDNTRIKPLKICLTLSTLFFSSIVFATSTRAPAYPTLQFDSANNTWPTTFTPINNMAYISGIITLGKNSFAYGCATVQEKCGHTVGGKLVAFNDGTGWQNPQPVQGIEKITPPFIAQYPDTLQSPAVWIIGLNNSSSYLLSYFDGKTISPAMTFPFAPDVTRPSFFFESHHLGYAIDYNANRIYYTSNTQWNNLPWPGGNIAAVTTDKLTDDLYVLGLDTSQNPNRYFIRHLTSNNQWSPPTYTDLYRSNTTFLRDIMVMNGGRIVNVLNQNSAGVQVIVSQSGGNYFVNKGNIPYSGDMPANPTFGLIYNGNKGNIFWSIISHSQDYYDTIAYLDTNSPNPDWKEDHLPEPMTTNHAWNTTSNDGTQFWVYGSTYSSHQNKVYYDDLKQGVVDTQFSKNNKMIFMEAMNQGKAFGIGLHTIGLAQIWTGYYFDGETWKITPWANVTPPFILPLPSGGTKNSWPLTWNPDNRYNFIVDESSKNIWTYLTLILPGKNK